MFCKHEWEIVDKEILKSPFEQIEKHMERYEKLNAGPEMFKMKYICILKCIKCGRLEEVVEENP